MDNLQTDIINQPWYGHRNNPSVQNVDLLLAISQHLVVLSPKKRYTTPQVQNLDLNRHSTLHPVYLEFQPKYKVIRKLMKNMISNLFSLLTNLNKENLNSSSTYLYHDYMNQITSIV